MAAEVKIARCVFLAKRKRTDADILWRIVLEFPLTRETFAPMFETMRQYVFTNHPNALWLEPVGGIHNGETVDVLILTEE